MEGNERRHVEERLKLLRNVQTMLNASASLMQQYQMVVANLPPIPIQTQPVASTSSAAPADTTAKSEEKPSSSLASEADKNQVKLEDIGSEDHYVDLGNKSTSSATLQPSPSKITTTTIDSPPSSSTFIASESSSSTNGESEEACEIRKRRLQKFVQSSD